MVDATTTLVLDAERFKSSARDAVSSFDRIEEAADKTVRKVDEVSESTQKMGMSMRSAFTSVTSGAASLVALNMQYGSINDRMLAVRTTQLALARQQSELNRIIEDGEAGTEKYHLKLEQLAITQEQLQKKTDDVKNAQIQFGFQLIGTLGSLKTMAEGVKALASADTLAAIALKAKTAATTLNTIASAMNPWLAVATAAAIAATVVLVSQNVLGLGDAFNELTGATKENTEASGPMLDNWRAYGDVSSKVGETTEKTTKSIKDNTTAVMESVRWYTSLTDTMVDMSVAAVAARAEVDKINEAWGKWESAQLEAIAPKKNDRLKIPKKDPVVSDFDRVLNESASVASIRVLIEAATEEYNNGNLAGALYIERLIQSTGRAKTNTISSAITREMANAVISSQIRTGQLRSIEQQMAINARGNGPQQFNARLPNPNTLGAQSLANFSSDAFSFRGTHGEFTQALTQKSFGNVGGMTLTGAKSKKHSHGSNRHEEYMTQLWYDTVFTQQLANLGLTIDDPDVVLMRNMMFTQHQSDKPMQFAGGDSVGGAAAMFQWRQQTKILELAAIARAAAIKHDRATFDYHTKFFIEDLTTDRKSIDMVQRIQGAGNRDFIRPWTESERIDVANRSRWIERTVSEQVVSTTV